MLLESIKFENFRGLRDAMLPVGRVTVLIGPNASGKSTALLSLKAAAEPTNFSFSSLCSVGSPVTEHVRLSFSWSGDRAIGFSWAPPAAPDTKAVRTVGLSVPRPADLQARLAQSRVFAFDPGVIAKPAALERSVLPGQNGEGLASVLTSLQDRFPENFEQLIRELHRWLPDFDRILLDTTERKNRIFMLRTAVGRHSIPATSLSEGTLVAVALLTLAHLPDPPPIIGLEEPDRGVHPRLLRDVQDAIFRLARPEDCGIDRPPVQVILTTHSPYMVDLFRDTPEDIVLAEKDGLWGSFRRLIDVPNIDELLRDAHLGDAWYSGVFGGVPAGT
jgi:predicted ATPase